MASNSKILRERRLRNLERSYRTKRNELKYIKIYGKTPGERFKAMLELDRMDKNGSRTRQRRRCSHCYRPRGVNRIGLCSQHTREAIGKGLLPGVIQGRQ
jgi:small subunit ribosomal protein S14